MYTKFAALKQNFAAKSTTIQLHDDTVHFFALKKYTKQIFVVQDVHKYNTLKPGKHACVVDKLALKQRWNDISSTLDNHKTSR